MKSPFNERFLGADILLLYEEIKSGLERVDGHGMKK